MNITSNLTMETIPVNSQREISQIDDNLGPEGIPSLCHLFFLLARQPGAFCFANGTVSLFQQFPVLDKMSKVEDNVNGPEPAGPQTQFVGVKGKPSFLLREDGKWRRN